MLANTRHPQSIHSGSQCNAVLAVGDLLRQMQHFKRRELREIALIPRPAAAIEVIRRIASIHPVILPPAVVQDVSDTHRRHCGLPNLRWSNLPGPESTEKPNTCTHCRRVMTRTTRKAFTQRVDALAGPSRKDRRTGI